MGSRATVLFFQGFNTIALFLTALTTAFERLDGRALGRNRFVELAN